MPVNTNRNTALMKLMTVMAMLKPFVFLSMYGRSTQIVIK